VQLFDKEVKSFVYILEGTADKSKMQLPKDIKHGCKYMYTHSVPFIILTNQVMQSNHFIVCPCVSVSRIAQKHMVWSW